MLDGQDMDHKLARVMIEGEVKRRFGDRVSPYTRDFVYGAQFAGIRTGIVIGPARMTWLSAFVREGLSDQERKTMFPSPFDLGNNTAVPQELFKLTALVSDLCADQSIPGAEASLETVKDIREKLAETLGRPIYIEGTALKVIKLLYRLSRRESTQLFDLIKPPSADCFKPSLEFKDSYPIKKSAYKQKGLQDFVHLIADLKGYLSLELEPARLEAISTLIDTLEAVMEPLLEEARRQLARWGVGRLQEISQALDELLDLSQWSKEDHNIPLDEDLYLYLTVLEFAHRGRVRPDIDSRMPQLEVTPIVQELMDIIRRSLAEDEQGRLVHRFYPVDQLQVFFSEYKSELIAAVEKAVCVSLKGKKYATACRHATTLLMMRVLLRLMPRTTLIDPAQVVAALCTVAYGMKHRKDTYKPHVHGEGNISGSLVGALNEAEHLISNGEDFTRVVREEYVTLWQEWLGWFESALVGDQQKEVGLQDLRTKLMFRLSDLALTRNLKVIRQGCDALKDYTARLKAVGLVPTMGRRG